MDVVIVQAGATIAAAFSAWFAWRAPNTSRAIAEDQRRVGQLVRLKDMHEALVHLGTVLARTPTPVIEFDAARRVVKRQAVLLPKFIADGEQLNSLLAWLSSPEEEEDETTSGRMIARDYIGYLEEPLTSALRYVEFRMQSNQ